MPLRRAYGPLQPEFDDFLFAAVGKEVNGIPLSALSMLTQLGFDPWREAAHLASLARREAVEQLAQIIARLPRTRWADDEREEIADVLIELLPRHATATDLPAAPQLSDLKRGVGKNVLSQARPWLIGVILGAAILVGLIAHGGWRLGDHQPSEIGSTTQAPRN